MASAENLEVGMEHSKILEWALGTFGPVRFFSFFVFLYCIISLEGDFESVHGWFLLRVANMDFSRGVGIWVFFATGGTG